MSDYDCKPGLHSKGGLAGEKRRGDVAIPLNLRQFLNDAQMDSMRQMESFGWQLAFVRRSRPQVPTVVVLHKQKQSYGVLEEDGSINTALAVGVR